MINNNIFSCSLFNKSNSNQNILIRRFIEFSSNHFQLNQKQVCYHHRQGGFRLFFLQCHLVFPFELHLPKLSLDHNKYLLYRYDPFAERCHVSKEGNIIVGY